MLTFDYSVLVPRGGYKWRRDKLIAVQHHQKEGFLDSRSPLCSPTLYDDFARLPPERDAILRFVNKHGPLYYSPEDPDEPDDTFKTWCRDIARMRFSVDLWKAIKSTNMTFLKECIEWHNGLPRLRHAPIIQAGKTTRKLFKPRNYRVAALVCLEEFLIQIAYGSRPATLALRPKYDSDRDNLGFSFVPQTLIAGLWFQFVIAVSEGREVRYCERCGKGIDISQRGRRKDTRFCSGQCRQRESRRRKKGGS